MLVPISVPRLLREPLRDDRRSPSVLTSSHESVKSRFAILAGDVAGAGAGVSCKGVRAPEQQHAAPSVALKCAMLPRCDDSKRESCLPRVTLPIPHSKSLMYTLMKSQANGIYLRQWQPARPPAGRRHRSTVPFGAALICFALFSLLPAPAQLRGKFRRSACRAPVLPSHRRSQATAILTRAIRASA
jgi:hypothetical protein